MMKKNAQSFSRLPGRSRKHFGFFSREQQELWLTNDHLLLILHDGFTERYKRFYFGDIRLLIMTRTQTGRIANVFGGIFIAFAFLLGVPLATEGGIASVIIAATLGVIAAIVAVCLVLNTAFGPTCICRLHTPVQVERLYSLGRVRTAQKVMEQLRVQIETVQGSFPVASSIQPPNQQQQASGNPQSPAGNGQQGNLPEFNNVTPE